jgi:hypothetical protein
MIFHISVDGKDAAQFDEQIRVLSAYSLEDAFFKARVIGKKEDETFQDASNKTVCWKFIDVAELYPLDEVDDGGQLFSSSHITSDTQSYIQYVRNKSMEIQAKSLTFA